MKKFSLFEKRIDSLQLTDSQKIVIARIVGAATPKVAAEEISKNPNIVTARDILVKLGVITFSDGTLAALTPSGKQLAVDSNIIDDTGDLTDEGQSLLASEQDQTPAPTVESFSLLKTVNSLLENQKLSDVIEPLKKTISDMFPNSYLTVTHQTNIMDDITIRFSIEPKETWHNNIFQNAHYVIIQIDEKGKRRETGEGPYTSELLSSHISEYGVKFRKKTGTLEQVIKSVVEFFKKLKEATVNKS